MLVLKYSSLLLILCWFDFLNGMQFKEYIQAVTYSGKEKFNNEHFYANLTTDYANSPLVECSYLPEEFYECPNVHENNSTNCTKWGMTKYSDVEFNKIKCQVFDNIECRGQRFIEISIPCIKYTDKYFITTLLYSIFLGMFAVDRCCIGHTGIGIGKLITVGGIGIWYIIDIILLILGIIKPSDDSNWIPFF